jgi:hypothetical protein
LLNRCGCAHDGASAFDYIAHARLSRLRRTDRARTAQPLSLDEAQFREIGTLVSEHDPEPTFAEYLPGKINYWSADAPIAPRYFPYNRCGVWACSSCGRLYLRYTEGGGYFVDRRIRAVRWNLIEDVSL